MARRWLFAVALFVVARCASAAGGVAVIQNAQVWLASGSGYSSDAYFPTKDQAFAVIKGKLSAAYPGTNPGGYCANVRTVTFGAYTWQISTHFAANGYPDSCGAEPAPIEGAASFFPGVQNICPSNATGLPAENPSSCTCNAGYRPNTGATACVPDCNAMTTMSSGYYDVGPNSGADPKILACAGNCEVIFDGTSPAGSAIVNGEKHWFAKGSYIATGGACTPAKQDTSQVGDGSATKPEDTCADGQAKGQLNGKTVCVDQSGDGTRPTDESKDKGTTKKETSSQTNPDGSTTTTETTTKTDPSGNKEVTVVRTTTRPDGSSSVESETTGSVDGGNKDTQPDDSEKGECEKNSSAAGCGGEAATIGGLYSPKDKTIDGVFASARDSFMSSPMGSAVGGFFVVSNSGTCPQWTAHVDYLNATFTIDQFCSEFAAGALLLLKAAVIVAASFFAFRIAVE